MTIQFEISEYLYKCLKKRIELGAASEMDMLVAKGKVVEQEPKAAIYSGDGYADGYMVYYMAECPNCGYEYEEGDKDWKEPFCPHCGQALKWESEDN